MSRLQPSPTTGNASVQFMGANFVFGATVNASYTNLDGVTYAASGCSVDDGVASLTCYTVPGYGAALSWSVWMSGAPIVLTGIASLITSYGASSITEHVHLTSWLLLSSPVFAQSHQS